MIYSPGVQVEETQIRLFMLNRTKKKKKGTFIKGYRS